MRSYTVLSDSDQWGGADVYLHAMFCAIAQAWLDEHEPSGVAVYIRPTRQYEIRGCYEGCPSFIQRLLLGDNIPEEINELLNGAWEAANATYSPGSNDPSSRCGQCVLEAIVRTVCDEVDLRGASTLAETLEAIYDQSPRLLASRILGDGENDPTIYDWLVTWSEVLDRDMFIWRHIPECSQHEGSR